MSHTLPHCLCKAAKHFLRLVVQRCTTHAHTSAHMNTSHLPKLQLHCRTAPQLQPGSLVQWAQNHHCQTHKLFHATSTRVATPNMRVAHSVFCYARIVGIQPSSTTPAGPQPFVQTATQHISTAASCYIRKARSFLPKQPLHASSRQHASSSADRQSRHTAAAACKATRAQAAHGSAIPCKAAKQQPQRKPPGGWHVLCCSNGHTRPGTGRQETSCFPTQPSKHTPKMQGTRGKTRKQPAGKPANVRGGDAQGA
jgi:hypothetical protein